MEDFISSYLDYQSNNESADIYHRWCALSGISAILNNQYYFQHGNFVINPNQYIMLMGIPGARKSYAIKSWKKLLKKSGFGNFSADKTTKEKYFLDLIEASLKQNNSHDLLEVMLNSEVGEKFNTITQCVQSYVVIDEFNDFFGNTNVLDFCTWLGTIWDHEGEYESRIKNGESVKIPQPVINILGGNTPTNFSKIFPTEILGQGFLSRMLLIHGDPTGRKCTFLEEPDEDHTQLLISFIHAIKERVKGKARLTQGAKELIDKIYKTPINFYDVRFESYPTRRFPALIKLCLVTSAARLSTEIDTHDVLYANTILSYAELFMGKALGEFGRARNSDTSHKIVQFIENSRTPVQLNDLWRQVSNDLDKLEHLIDILRSLEIADKIQKVKDLAGRLVFLPKKILINHVTSDMIDYSLLTFQERSKLS